MPLEAIENKIIDVLSREKYYTQYGTAKDVDKVKRTCTFVPAGDEAESLDVRFQPLMGSVRGLAIIPVEGSAIAVTFVNQYTGIVVGAEDIDEIIYQGGENGGLINIETLKTELAKNNAIITNLLTVLNGVPITEAGNGAVSALQAVLSTAVEGLPVGDFNGMEDKLFKH